MGPAEKCLSDSRFDGGLVFDAHGNHFANVLEGRDYVLGEMWKNKPPFRNTVSF